VGQEGNAKGYYPFCRRWWIRNFEDVRVLLDLSVNKVSVNTAAVRNPEIVMKASRKFNKENLVDAIDGRKNSLGISLPRLEVVVKSDSESTGVDVVDWAKRVEELGAGEILLTSKDADGTEKGYDLEMTRAVAEAVSIPVIASGGAGKSEHFYEAVTIGKAAAVLAASVFHFGEISISGAPKYLKEQGISVNI